jgi:cytidine deaminase
MVAQSRVGSVTMTVDTSSAGDAGVGAGAEHLAVAAAVAAGESRLDAVAIAGSKAEPIAPCGGCRQVLREFGSVMLVVSEGLDGERAHWTLADLLPKAYGADRLR